MNQSQKVLLGLGYGLMILAFFVPPTKLVAFERVRRPVPVTDVSLLIVELVLIAAGMLIGWSMLGGRNPRRKERVSDDEEPPIQEIPA